MVESTASSVTPVADSLGRTSLLSSGIMGDVTATTIADIKNSTILGRVGDVQNLYVLKKGTLKLTGTNFILD